MAGFDRAGGSVALLADARSPAGELARLRVGDEARLDGPFGRGFEIDPRSRHLLVVARDPGVARVRAVVDEAVAGGRQVTVLVGASAAGDVFPSSLLPDEAEYVVATEDGSLGHTGSVIDLVLEYEAWADQCFAAGPMALLEELAAVARGRDARLGVARLGRRRRRAGDAAAGEPRQKAWLQVVLGHELGCALGVCLGCVVPGRDGPVRMCREGPVFAAAELAWEGHP